MFPQFCTLVINCISSLRFYLFVGIRISLSKQGRGIHYFVCKCTSNRGNEFKGEVIQVFPERATVKRLLRPGGAGLLPLSGGAACSAWVGEQACSPTQIQTRERVCLHPHPHRRVRAGRAPVLHTRRPACSKCLPRYHRKTVRSRISVRSPESLIATKIREEIREWYTLTPSHTLHSTRCKYENVSEDRECMASTGSAWRVQGVHMIV